ncbi:MAG: ZIP family metal transporter [Candidatus Micrarchaeota archaeon]|nr:ZIP family metal transporter [Candidatus Micrarchaeota archaeon]
MPFSDLFLGALLAFAATAAGAALVLPIKGMKGALFALLISFSGGVMAFSALEMLLQSHAASGNITALAGLALGLCAFFVLDRIMPHAHAFVSRAPMERHKKKAALLAGTITLHNIPEGFAIASAFAASPSLGWLVAATIAIQDFPEGLIVSAPLSAYGMGARRSFFWGAFSGFVEFLAAIAGFLFLSTVSAATPFALAFSAGAMAFVTFSELMPDALRAGDKARVALTFLAGAALACALSLLLAVKQ